jgi:predicted transcriptional regulator
MADIETKSVFDVPPDAAAEAEADAAADAEIEAGRFVPHDKVVEWLKSWGTPNELPCPEPESR